MVFVLCIGDFHIPHRATDLPKKFKELLKPGKIHHVLCSGNLCTQDTYDYLRSLCSNVLVAQGDFDDNNSFEDTLVTQIGNFKVGLCHGHQVVPWGDLEALAILQRQLDCDILVTGHTHKFQAMKYQDRVILNPGSATGAYCSFNEDVRPSFLLMDIEGNKARVFVYELVGDELKVEKIEFERPEPL